MPRREIVWWTDGRHTVGAVKARTELGVHFAVTAIDDEGHAVASTYDGLPPGGVWAMRCGETAVYVGVQPGLERAVLADRGPDDVVEVAAPCWLVAAPVGKAATLDLTPGGPVNLATVELEEVPWGDPADFDDPEGWTPYPSRDPA